jgi:hypothetical protein
LNGGHCRRRPPDGLVRIGGFSKATARQAPWSKHYDLLEAYARRIADRDREQSLQSLGTRLLAAIREAFSVPDAKGHVPIFYPTGDLLEVLNQDETFKQLNYGKGLGPESLRGLLDTYRDGSGRPISSVRQKGKKQLRGFYREQFVDAWDRYLPPLVTGNSSTSSNPTKG